MPRHLGQEISQRVVELRARGQSQRDIADALGMTQGAVSKILRRHQETGTVRHRSRSGRPRISTLRDDRSLVRMSLRDRFLSAPRLRSEWVRQIGRRSSVRTVRRRLKSAGLNACRVAKCPALTRLHRQTRVQWCQRHSNWEEGHWRHTVFSDESRFTLYSNDGRRRVRRRRGERLLECCVAQNHGNRGPSVMVWGAIHHGDKSELVILDRTLNQYGYIDILRDNMLPFARRTFQHNFVYVQDNATPHVARRTADFLHTQEVEVMAWPPRSPDMNPIEHVWDQMGVFIREMENPPTNLAELRHAVQAAWDSVTQDSIADLIDGMPRRVAALAAARGGYTRY